MTGGWGTKPPIDFHRVGQDGTRADGSANWLSFNRPSAEQAIDEVIDDSMILWSSLCPHFNRTDRSIGDACDLV